jgi:hypothetical protein
VIEGEWQTFRLDGRELHALHEQDCWRLRLEEREAADVHLDRAFAELLNVPSHVALNLALALLNAEPGTEID